MQDLTIYQQMTASTNDLIKIINQEVGIKCCQPFAVRVLDALKELKLKDELEAKKAANVFLDNLQALIQGGILSEDYDKLDLVKRGNVITISARVQALIRSARRKGFMIIETVVGVPKEDDIYFEEQYKEGVGIIYLLKDKRINPDRDITAERLINNYFRRFLCRLEVKDLNNNRSIMTVTEMTNDEIMYAQSSSDNGLYLSEWIEYTDNRNFTRKKKVIHDGSNGTEAKLNKSSIWYKWTGEMVRKTIIRRALKNVKESLPELRDTIMAFDSDIEISKKYEDKPTKEDTNEIIIQGINNTDVDLHNLTAEQKLDVDEVFEIYKQNPNTANTDAEHLKGLYESGTPINEIINDHFAEIVNISKSKKLYPLVENIIKGVPYEKN